MLMSRHAYTGTQKGVQVILTIPVGAHRIRVTHVNSLFSIGSLETFII